MPADGPAIIAPNHFSFLDHFFVAVYLRRKVHFMAKSQLFQRPMQFVYTPRRRVPGAARPRRTRRRSRPRTPCWPAGDIVVMYCEGGRSRSGELGEAKPGIGRLALESGAPVVPTAIAGSERARNWKQGQFPKVTVQFGDPVRFEQVDEPTKEQSLAAAYAVFDRVKGLYGPLRSDGRRNAVRAARAARRAARSTRRRPVAPS